MRANWLLLLEATTTEMNQWALGKLLIFGFLHQFEDLDKHTLSRETYIMLFLVKIVMLQKFLESLRREIVSIDLRD